LLRCNLPVDSALDEVLAYWSERYIKTTVTRPVGDAAEKHREWDEPYIAVDVCRILASLPDRRNQAHLVAVTAVPSGD